MRRFFNRDQAAVITEVDAWLGQFPPQIGGQNTPHSVSKHGNERDNKQRRDMEDWTKLLVWVYGHPEQVENDILRIPGCIWLLCIEREKTDDDK